MSGYLLWFIASAALIVGGAALIQLVTFVVDVVRSKKP